MATPVFCCGFECGVTGTVGQHWNTFGTTPSISTSLVRTGARSARAVLAAGTFAGFTSTFTLSSNVIVIRTYVYFVTLPTLNTILLTTNASTLTVGFKASDSKIYPLSNHTNPYTFGSTGYEVTIGRWYRIDFYLNSSTNPHTLDIRVDGNPLTQLTRALGNLSATEISFGVTNTENGDPQSCDIYYDDFILSTTLADYPLGPGAIWPLVPTADGTHNVAGTADFRRTLTATDILNATTTAFQLVDDVPLESGASVDWINMLAPVNATDYVECIFGPAPGVPIIRVAPRTIEVIAAIHQAATTTGNMEIRINDNGTMNAMYSATAVAGVTTIVYKRKHYATAIAGGGAWVVGGGGNGDITDLRVRFGSPAVLDVVPDQYFDSIMIEAEFPEPKQKIVQVKQAVNRSNTY